MQPPINFRNLEIVNKGDLMVKKNNKGFKIHGEVVTKETGKGIPGLVVEALDKDLFIDDRLGLAVTDDKGKFEILYGREEFQECFFDRKPDIYLRIKDKAGKVIHTTKEKVRYEADRTEAFRIAIEHGGDIVKKNVVKVALLDPQRKIVTKEGKVTLKPIDKGEPVYSLKYKKRI